MHLPNCPRCKTGIVVPFSDFSRNGTTIPFKSWACLACSFEMKIDMKGEIKKWPPVEQAQRAASSPQS